MSVKDDIQQFITTRNIAIAGVSRNGKKFGNLVYQELKAKGWQVFGVNPLGADLGEDFCYPSFESLHQKVDGVLITVKRDQALEILRQAHEAGIQRAWMHGGAVSPEAEEFCRTVGMTCIMGRCILMYADPVAFPHNLHRGVARLFGRL